MDKCSIRNTISFLGKEIDDFFSLLICLRTTKSDFSSCIFSYFICSFVFFAMGITASAQPVYPQNNYAINQPNNNYLANSTVFKQEIARMEITVVRAGNPPLSITQVPRLEKDDILKVRLLDEPVNSLKPDQSNFDWTFLVAFINPGRNNDSAKSVSEEINFRKRGWYKEYTFVVPYDCQPIFFLYPKPQYRSKILNLINKNPDAIKKIGEKTIEIADAYAKIGSFLNELQGVVNRNYYRSLYSNYGNYGSYGNNGLYGNNNRNFGYNDNFLAEQAVERIAKSFNIQLPNCWGGSTQYNTPGNNNPYNNNPYNNNPYNNNGYNNGYQNGMSNDLVGKVQCVARTVRVEDLDISVGRMLQQGGIFAVSELVQKYPQIAFWINIAAAALDFIIKITNKAPLKIIPTVVSVNENSTLYNAPQNYNAPPNNTTQNTTSASPKISLFAETQPSDNGFVTAYPMVFHKWQANADPDLINLPMPVLMDSCLHVGQNIIRTTDIVNDWMTDNFTKEFQFTVSSSNGFQKKFPLKKNVGFSGWELILTKEELNLIPKINTQLIAKITGKRGFNNIQSPDFNIQMSSADNWIVESNSQKSFAIGGKKIVTLRNQNGNCRCLETIVYKPTSGGELLFDSKKMVYSPDGRDVSFEVDTTSFSSGVGQLELRQYGGEPTNLTLNLYPQPPTITNVKVAKGDSRAIIVGERLEQIQAIRINGKRAVAKTEADTNSGNRQPSSTYINNQTPSTYMNSQSPLTTKTNSMYMSSNALGEKNFVFEDSSQWQDSNNFLVELELDDQRIISQPNLFAVLPARPVISVNETKEIEGFVINQPTATTVSAVKNRTELSPINLPDTFSNLPIFPMETSKIGVNIQNALTDYDFKVENLLIETRVENTQINPFQENDINFEVLDWRSLRLNIQITEQAKKMLGGRRIQFRICDGKRGNSEWYSIKQTFVRIPQNLSVKCLNKQCELTGKGINYIQQISFDDGKTWFPQEPTGLVSKSTENGLETSLIPNFSANKRVLKIKLRDFPKTEVLLSVKLD